MSTIESQKSPTFADPSALGLFGLAMVTLVASTQKLGWTNGLSFVIPWAIFMGAAAQLFASVGDAIRGNVFGTTVFGAYGFFWLGVSASWMMKMGVFGDALAGQVDGAQLTVAVLGYLIFTIFMTIASLRTTWVLIVDFIFIDFLFLFIILSGFGVAPELTHHLAGWSELIIAIISLYGSVAAVLNTMFGSVVLPVGKGPLAPK